MNKELPYGMQKFLDTLKYVNKFFAPTSADVGDRYVR